MKGRITLTSALMAVVLSAIPMQSEAFFCGFSFGFGGGSYWYPGYYYGYHPYGYGWHYPGYAYRHYGYGSYNPYALAWNYPYTIAPANDALPEIAEK